VSSWGQGSTRGARRTRCGALSVGKSPSFAPQTCRRTTCVCAFIVTRRTAELTQRGFLARPLAQAERCKQGRWPCMITAYRKEHSTQQVCMCRQIRRVCAVPHGPRLRARVGTRLAYHHRRSVRKRACCALIGMQIHLRCGASFCGIEPNHHNR